MTPLNLRWVRGVVPAFLLFVAILGALGIAGPASSILTDRSSHQIAATSRDGNHAIQAVPAEMHGSVERPNPPMAIAPPARVAIAPSRPFTLRSANHRLQSETPRRPVGRSPPLAVA